VDPRFITALACLLIAEACSRAPASPPTPTATAPQYTLTPINPDLTKDQIAHLVEELYGLVERTQVVSIIDEQHVYRVSFKLASGNDKVQTVLVTRDGRFLSEGFIDVAARHEELARDKRFSDCLASKNVRVFVTSRDPASLDQLRELGALAAKVMIDCSNEPGDCKKLGIQSFPAVAVGDAPPESGKKPRAWFETKTGCK
jgi:hypothetical protein